MTIKNYKILFATIVSLIVLLDIGCEKKDEYKHPTLRFSQPDSNLIIDRDTVISFVIEPYDKDCKIARVEFSLNETIVSTVSTSPYYFDWSIKTEENFGNNRIKATVYDNNGAKGEAEIMIEVKSYLTRWLGTYEGTSRHVESYPKIINDQFQLVTNVSYRNVSINVEIGDQDSCLYFLITYNDSIIDTKEDLLFSNLGFHFSQWGVASGYGSLNISFESDSMHYNYFQKCGIPCDSGVDFDIKKND